MKEFSVILDSLLEKMRNEMFEINIALICHPFRALEYVFPVNSQDFALCLDITPFQGYQIQ